MQKHNIPLQSTTKQVEMLSNNKKLNEIKLNFNHEFSEKFIVLDDKCFKNSKTITVDMSRRHSPLVNASDSLKQMKSKTSAIIAKKLTQINKYPASSQNIKQTNSSLLTKSMSNIIEHTKLLNNKQTVLNKNDNKANSQSELTNEKSNLKQNVNKKRMTAVLNTKAKLLNRVKKQKKAKTDNKISANLLNQLMTSLISYLKDNKKKLSNDKKDKKKNLDLCSYSTDEPTQIMERYLLNTFTDPMDTKVMSASSLSTTTKSNSSSYSSLSRTTTSSNTSSSYFKMFSRPNYYKTLNDNKNNQIQLPSSTSCSSLSETNRQSSLYLSCDEKPLSNKSSTSSSSQRHKQLEIPNIDDPILFIDTLYNQLLANNSTLSNYKEDFSNTDKLCSAYDTDYTCRSSSRLIASDNNLTPNSHSRRSSISSNSSIEVSDIQIDETIKRVKELSIDYQHRKSISSLDLNKNTYRSITVDCSSTRPELKFDITNQSLNFLMTSSSQSSPSLSFLSTSGVDSIDKKRFNATNKGLYLSASMANLYSSSSFLPSMSTSMISSNQQNTSNNLSSISGSFKSPVLASYSRSNSLLMANSNSSDEESPNYIQILFESFLKSIKFLIMTKNVLILPIIIYLLNTKLKQFIKSTTKQSTSTSLFKTAASSIVHAASKSAKLKFNLD